MFKVAKKTLLAISLIFSFIWAQILPANQNNIDLSQCPITPSSTSPQNSTIQNTPKIFNLSTLLNLVRDSKGALDIQRLSKRDEIISTIGEFIKNDFFPKNFNGNLIFDPNFYGDQEKILQLIEYLENNKNNPSNVELLNVFNEFYHVWLFQFILSYTSMPKNLSIPLNTYYDELYNKKINVPDGNPVFPFRTALSKIMIYILIINDSSSKDPYRVRQENFVYLLNIIKQELIGINKKLTDQIKEQNIIDLIETLQIHAFDEPTLQPKNIKKYVIYSSLVITIAIICYIAYDNDLRERLKTSISEFWLWDVIKEKAGNIVEFIAEKFFDVAERRAAKTGQNFTAGAIKGVAQGENKTEQNQTTNPVTTKTEKKADTEINIYKEKIEDVVKSTEVKTKNDIKINPDIELLLERLEKTCPNIGQKIVDGILHKIEFPDEPNPKLELLLQGLLTEKNLKLLDKAGIRAGDNLLHNLPGWAGGGKGHKEEAPAQQNNDVN